jgi:hypothetical protein
MMKLTDPGSHHPLPTSPIKGEVQLHSCLSIQSHPPRGTSPLMGEARRGWGPTLDVGGNL